MAGTCIINGTSYNGSNICVTNNQVIIDGVVQCGEAKGVISIEITGGLMNLTSQSSVTVNGDVAGDVDCGGSLKCKNITGNADAGGSIQCRDVNGNVRAGGSIMADNIKK